MNKSGGALGVQKLNSATALIQRQPRRLLHAKYVLHRLGCSQENDQLLCEGWQRADSRVRRDSRHTIGLGPLDENSPATVDGGDGSDHLYGLDLRSSASARSRIEGGTSADAACYCRGQEEERSDRCPQDRGLLAVRFSAGVLHGLDRDSQASAHPALSESVGPSGRADEEQNRWPADGSRRELQQAEATQGWLLL